MCELYAEDVTVREHAINRGISFQIGGTSKTSACDRAAEDGCVSRFVARSRCPVFELGTRERIQSCRFRVRGN